MFVGRAVAITNHLVQLIYFIVEKCALKFLIFRLYPIDLVVYVC